jgi:hypothetical protein
MSGVAPPPPPRARAAELLAGFKLVLKSPYLLLVCGYLAMTCV